MIIDCISDLHGYYPILDGGDLLIVAGDLTASDNGSEYWEFIQWMSIQNYKKKIVVAGNHDNMIAKDQYKIHIVEDFDYLCDSGTEFEGLKVWGSPWTKTFPGMNPHCKAFTVDTEEELAEKWALIPKYVDILITHSPPDGILDKICYIDCAKDQAKNVGSKSLRNQVFNVCRPKLHVFGHVHESRGKCCEFNDKHDRIDIIFVNASYVNERYEPVNKPIRIIL